MEHTTKLKVNIKSLAAEAKIIRREESKLKKRLEGPLDASLRSKMCVTLMKLREHRKGPLRQETRVSQLAYAFLRGLPYSAVEAKVRDTEDWNYLLLYRKIADKLNRHAPYGVKYSKEQIKDWMRGVDKEPALQNAA